MSEPIRTVEDAVAVLGALPVPQGPEPLSLSEAQVEALAAAGNRVVNDAVHEDLCWCEAWPKACLSSGNFRMGDWDMAGLETALPAVLALWEQMRGGEMDRLRARIAELEAERHVTNEALDDAVGELRTSYAERARRETHPGRRQAWRMLAQIEESERVADALLTQALRGDDEFGLHHDYRVGRDLPESGGAR
ncbi:MAG: hypothetical protein HOY75_12985 [Streptomyces sp.]|nr:hypothetical protein [Streptomyces sp.]